MLPLRHAEEILGRHLQLLDSVTKEAVYLGIRHKSMSEDVARRV